jgi:hypothetical protein
MTVAAANGALQRARATLRERLSARPSEWSGSAGSEERLLLEEGLTSYLRAAGDTEFRAFKFDVLRIEGGRIAEITTFDATLFPAFGLPPTL